MIGLCALLYPTAAQWLSSYNQSQIVQHYASDLSEVDPDVVTQLDTAHAYNRALNSAAEVAADSPIPEGTGSSHREELSYEQMLRTSERGMMARLRYDAVNADLPVYHGTSDATLLRGAGHLAGTHLPVGGMDTHSVITAHRGLADATMFTHLDRAEVGDTFTIEVFGDTLAYRVSDVRVVQPHENESLRVVPGKDLVTLITCTPLGINSHRILVTGERVSPTPQHVVETAGSPSDLPGTPWWIVVAAGGLLCATWFLRGAGYRDGRLRAGRPAHGK
jgi:sortase A